jgi:hypothetical protein
VISRTTARFRSAFGNLEPEIKREARRAYRLFKRNPHHPTLRFKKVHPSQPIWSVRIVGGYRAVGVRAEDEIVWYWIGSHADYERLLSQRRRRP